MPIGPTNTKKQKQAVVHSEMHKFKHGTLHSGSKHGPVVKNRKQAVAIAMSESGQSKNKKAPAIGKGESKPSYDRSAHSSGNPGFGNPTPGGTMSKKFSEGKSELKHSELAQRGHEHFDAAGHEAQPHGKSIGYHDSAHGAEHHKGHGMGGEPHKFDRPPAGGSHGFGHGAHQRSGHLRHSGNSGAHRIGKR